MKCLLIAVSLLAIFAAVPADARDCGSRGCYRNRPHGHLVPRPNNDPRGATALCANGRYSHSEHPYAPGTCSGNGGVRSYLGREDGARTLPYRPRHIDPGETVIPVNPRETVIPVNPRETPLR